MPRIKTKRLEYRQCQYRETSTDHSRHHCLFLSFVHIFVAGVWKNEIKFFGMQSQKYVKKRAEPKKSVFFLVIRLALSTILTSLRINSHRLKCEWLLNTNMYHVTLFLLSCHSSQTPAEYPKNNEGKSFQPSFIIYSCRISH